MTHPPIKCAVILAAGFGSRLREADNCPKPLRPVGSVPLLVRVLRQLVWMGVGTILLAGKGARARTV